MAILRIWTLLQVNITQLVGLAFGLACYRLAVDKNIVSTEPLLRHLEAAE